MPITLTITAENADELTASILRIANNFQRDAATIAIINGGTGTNTDIAEVADATVAAKPAPKRTPPKPKATEPKADPAPEPKQTSYADLSAEDFGNAVRDTVLGVVNKHGRDYMQNILSAYGVERASLAAPEQRDELVSELEAALND